MRSKHSAAAFLPSPDFTCDLSNGCTYVAGIRPFREDTYRLEAVRIGTKFIVHNYGHGGAGITMSWGCADRVLRLVTQSFSPGPTRPVAVLGGGVMGLTAATLLRQAGFSVTIYAELLAGTTSDVAGGQWAPSIVEFNASNPTAAREFFDLLKTSYTMFRARLGPTFGVSERMNYCKNRAPGLDKVEQAGIIPPVQRLPHLPFEHLNGPGWAYQTLLVEPPIFLEKLRQDLRVDVPFVQKRFATRQQVLGLAEPIIINCTGLGSKGLFNDRKLKPIKGQLVLLKPQPALTYLYSTGETYVFPRTDHVVVGGSYEEGVSDPTPDPVRCERIRQMASDVFDGKTFDVLAREPWMLRDK